MLHIYRGPDESQVKQLALEASKKLRVPLVENYDDAHVVLMEKKDVIIAGKFAKYWNLNQLMYSAIMYEHPVIVVQVGLSEKPFEDNDVLELDFPFEWIVWKKIS